MTSFAYFGTSGIPVTKPAAVVSEFRGVLMGMMMLEIDKMHPNGLHV
jgi:hypothetical protein